MMNEYQDALLSFRIGAAIQSDYEIIEKLVKKATPIKPKVIWLLPHIFRCDCGNVVGRFHSVKNNCCDNYCSKCGQAIDWSDIE